MRNKESEAGATRVMDRVEVKKIRDEAEDLRRQLEATERRASVAAAMLDAEYRRKRKFREAAETMTAILGGVILLIGVLAAIALDW